MMNRVIYAGSFDPIHNGHLYIIDIATRLFDEVYLVVANNSEKYRKGLIEHSERLKLINRVMKRKFPKVKVISLKNVFIADFAKDNDIKYLIRGLRHSDDFNQEKLMSRVNSEIGNGIETIFVMSPVELNTYSSSLIKGFVGLVNWEDKIKKMVPVEIYEHILFNYSGGKHDFMRAIRYCLDEDEDAGSEYLNDDLNIKIESLFNYIHLAYTDKSKRIYHDLNHILYMNKELDSIDTSIDSDIGELTDKNIQLIKIAIWFHDYIYNPEKKDNEKASAEQAKLMLTSLGLKEEDIESIFKMIVATEHIEEDFDDSLEKIICDLDMSLGGKSNIEEWFTTTNKIRKEYSMFDDKKWNAGRLEFLKSMLKKKHIFKTEYFRNKYEDNIRNNIKIELKNLQENIDDEPKNSKISL